MSLEELAAKIEMLEDKARTLEDIEEIKKLQRAYGQVKVHLYLYSPVH
jgi:hypothetical protein